MFGWFWHFVNWPWCASMWRKYLVSSKVKVFHTELCYSWFFWTLNLQINTRSWNIYPLYIGRQIQSHVSTCWFAFNGVISSSVIFVFTKVSIKIILTAELNNMYNKTSNFGSQPQLHIRNSLASDFIWVGNYLLAIHCNCEQ